MQQTPILYPPNIACGEGMIMLAPAQQQAAIDAPKNWNQKLAKGVGIATIAVVVVALVCNAIWYSLQFNRYAVIECVLFVPVLVSGVLLTLASFRPKRSLVIVVLVTSIIANGFGSFVFFSDGGVLITLGTRYYDTASSDESFNKDGTTALLGAHIGVGVWFVLLGLANFGLLLTASIMSCKSICGRDVSPCPAIAFIPQGMSKNPDGSTVSAQHLPFMTSEVKSSGEKSPPELSESTHTAPAP